MGYLDTPHSCSPLSDLDKVPDRVTMRGNGRKTNKHEHHTFARQAYASYFHLLMHLIYAFILLECRGEVRVLRRPTESMSKNKAWEEGASYILARGHPFTLSYIS